MRTRLIALTLLLGIALPAFAQESQQSFEATVRHLILSICAESSTQQCARLEVESSDPAFSSEPIIINTNADDTANIKNLKIREGDAVVIQTEEINGTRQYFVSDVVRRSPLIWLTIIFIIAVIAFGGMSAVRSFAGMVVSLLVIIFFMIPRILAGDPPLLLAFISSLFIMLVTFLLTHGWNKKTIAAFGGTATSLLLTALLATGFSVYARITGRADEEMLFLLADYPSLNTHSIVLAGILIGTLGVLDDITISQASAVFELRKANMRYTVRDLYNSACRIGRDHIAAAVNTLVLAYAGTALPLLLLLVGIPAGESMWTFINREMIATEILRTLTGSIGLLAAVPLTTLIAAFLAVKTPQPEGAHDIHIH